MALFSFNRSYTLTVEVPPAILPPSEEYSNTPLENVSPFITTKDDYRNVVVQQAVQITDLQIKANITFTERTTGSEPIKATIEIYNLSTQTRQQIESTNGIVVLEAGYEDSEKMIFSGQILQSSTEKRGPDMVTTLLCKDGYTPLNGVRYSKSFSRGSTYGEIFRDIVSEFANNGISSSDNGVILDQISPPIEFSPEELTLEKSWTFSGYLRQALDRLCTEFNYKWQIIHSRLYIYPVDYPEMVGQVILGVDNILSIEEYQDGTTTTSTDTQSGGVEVKLFLEGDIDMSKILVIESDGNPDSKFSRLAGNYRIVDGKHVCDFEGRDWYTIIRCDKQEDNP